ncbi:MAG: Hsp33 family molecular chaperone HslO [Gammaproteobacteria bacterium]|nr:Hsp33 family molecular chaperone HslO [Gammaproteobacteria bacterium]
MSDQLERFIFSQHDIRGQLITLSDSYREILSHNPLPPTVAKLLGEFLAAACLLSTTLKFEGTLSLQASGEGEVPMIVAECTHHRDLRGIARLAKGAEITEGATLHQLVGDKSALMITIVPQRGERYQGVVPLQRGTLAECLEDYFSQSEQLATRFWIEAGTDSVGGLMLQALPGSDDADSRETWETAAQLAATVTATELQQLAHEVLVHRLFHELGPRSFGSSKFRFKCSCSPERSARALIAMGAEEVYQLLSQQSGEITADCQFCNRRYRFNQAQVEALFNPPPHTMH